MNRNKISFKLDVPYKLIQSDEKKPRPLIIYLHGYKQNINLFERKVSGLLSFNTHHLLLQGPYPIYDETHKRIVENWGRAWYCMTADKSNFVNRWKKL